MAMFVIVSRPSMSMCRSASPVDADRADDVEDEVLGLDPLREAVVVDELERLRDAEPELAEGEHAGQVGGPDAGGEVVEGAVGAGVGVGSHHQLARQHQPSLRQHRVADAALAHLEVPLDAHVARELARQPPERGAGRVLRGLEVVLDHSHPIRVPHPLRAHLLAHDLARGRDGEVVAHREIDLRQHDLARPHRVAAAGAGEDLLRHGHAHRLCL
jgi:hypothetical protein